MGNRIIVTFNAIASDRPDPEQDKHTWRKRHRAPARCDYCRSRLLKLFVKGLTEMGLHKTMCVTCHKAFGTGLGTGHGTLYSIDADGVFSESVWG